MIRTFTLRKKYFNPLKIQTFSVRKYNTDPFDKTKEEFFKDAKRYQNQFAGLDEDDNESEFLDQNELEMLFNEFKKSQAGLENTFKNTTEQIDEDPTDLSPQAALVGTAAMMKEFENNPEVKKIQDQHRQKVEKSLTKKKPVEKLTKEELKEKKLQEREKEKVLEKEEQKKQLQRLGIKEKDASKKLKNMKQEESDDESGSDDEKESKLQKILASKIEQKLQQAIIEVNKDDLVQKNVIIQYVKIEKDLKKTNVKWSPKLPLKHPQMQKINETLHKIGGVLAGFVGKELNMKYSPEFKFYYDVDLRDTSANLSKMKEPIQMLNSFKKGAPVEEVQKELEEVLSKKKTFIDNDVKKKKTKDFEKKEFKSEKKEIKPEKKEVKPEKKEIKPEKKEVKPEKKEVKPEKIQSKSMKNTEDEIDELDEDFEDFEEDDDDDIDEEKLITKPGRSNEGRYNPTGQSRGGYGGGNDRRFNQGDRNDQNRGGYGGERGGYGGRGGERGGRGGYGGGRGGYGGGRGGYGGRDGERDGERGGYGGGRGGYGGRGGRGRGGYGGRNEARGGPEFFQRSRETTDGGERGGYGGRGGRGGGRGGRGGGRGGFGSR